jgi:hypothetical protein
MVRWTRWASLAVALACCLFIPGEALGLVLSPPGHPGTNQYVEIVPTSNGNAAPPGSVNGSGSANPGSQTLSGLGQGRRGDTRLAALGRDGKAAAALAAATAPVPVPRDTAAAERKAAAASGGGSAATGISRTLTGSDTGGLGILLPLLLATSLIVAVGILAARMSARGTRPKPSL